MTIKCKVNEKPQINHGLAIVVFLWFHFVFVRIIFSTNIFHFFVYIQKKIYDQIKFPWDDSLNGRWIDIYKSLSTSEAVNFSPQNMILIVQKKIVDKNFATKLSGWMQYYRHIGWFAQSAFFDSVVILMFYENKAKWHALIQVQNDTITKLCIWRQRRF